MNGRVDKAYERMYHIAESLAVHEMKQRTGKFISSASKKLDIVNNPLAYPEEMVKYKLKRIEYHLNRMENLLKLRKDIQEEKNKF